jgi:hypothetical protein
MTSLGKGGRCRRAGGGGGGASGRADGGGGGWERGCLKWWFIPNSPNVLPSLISIAIEKSCLKDICPVGCPPLDVYKEQGGRRKEKGGRGRKDEGGRRKEGKKDRGINKNKR